MDSFGSVMGARLAQIGGIYGSVLLTGFLGSFSYLVVPAIEIAPCDTLLKQYQRAGAIGFTTSPRLALGTAGAYAWLAYKAFRSNEYTASKAYGIAAILTPMMIPFTFMFITSTNAQLNRLASIAADDVAKVDKTEVRRLIQRWKVLNYRRTFLVFIASGFGLLGTLAWRL
ncbi:MAG: hypothetical protein FE78DRAFT_105280 [Acidomyces sp. 'richmondensis']|nr:MAG: hypothetical protein FE78DRAFT_105280 [Acidomyces sp. 'richmondensis']